MNQISFVFSGDWQAELKNLDRCQLIVDQLCEIIHNESRPRYFVHLGDAKQHFNPIDQRVSNFLISATVRIRALCDGFYYVRGNHDSITTQDGVPSCVPLFAAAGADIVTHDQPEIVRLHGLLLALVPYFRDPLKQRDAFKEAAHFVSKFPSVKKLLAFHNEIEGCERSAHMKGKGLMMVDMDAQVYDLCIGGHIHRPQFMQPNVVFAGSPFCQDWGEVNERKRHVVVRVNNSGVQSYSHASVVPGWYDPGAPGYQREPDWAGTSIRISVPVGISLDPAKELTAARKLYEKKYPGAKLQLVPKFEDEVKANAVDVSGSDDKLLRSYFEQQSLPEGIFPEQLVGYLSTLLPKSGVLGVQGLKFESVTAVNVLCFEKAEMTFDEPGITLVTGRNSDWGDTVSNGAGKTSLLSLPFLALTGKTFKGQTHDGWAHRWAGSKPSIVQVTGTLPDGSKLRVLRGRKPPMLRVYRDDKEITMGDVNGTQALIERLTNWTWDVLTNSVYIGQREMGSVFGTEKERKELFSRLLGLSRFLGVQDKIRKAVSKNNIYVNEVDAELRSSTAALNEAESGAAQIKTALEAYAPLTDRDLKERAARISDLQAKINDREAEIAFLEPQLEENQKEFEAWHFKVLESEAFIRSWKEQFDSSTKLKGGKCPTCGSKVTTDSLAKHVDEIMRKMAEEETKVEAWEELQNRNRTARRGLMEFVGKNRIENAADQKKISAMQTELTKLEEQKLAADRLRAILEDKQAHIGKLTRKKSVDALAKLGGLEHGQFLEICSQAVGRDGLPAYLCSVVAPSLNAAAQRYSQVFSGGEISLKFEMSGGDIDVEVQNLHGGTRVEDLSEGELRMAGIVAAFSFRDVLVHTGILVLDEPGEGLDSENAAAFAKGLNEIAGEFGSVFVISHNANILSRLEPNQRLEVVKSGRVASIVKA